MSLNTAEKVWAAFASVAFEALTPFVVFEASAGDTALTAKFLLKLELVGAPSNRRERVLKSILSDRQKVLRFLLLLLSDEEAAGFSALFREPNEKGGDKSNSLFGDASLFESLVRALDRDPQRIDQISRIIDDLRQLPEGESLLPERLDEIWRPIWAVRESQRQLSRTPMPVSEGVGVSAANEPVAAIVAESESVSVSPPADAVVEVPAEKEIP